MVKLRFWVETAFKNDEKCMTCEKEDTGPENHSYQYNVGYFGENDNLGTDKCLFSSSERVLAKLVSLESAVTPQR